MRFGALIIGDELFSGKRRDAHFDKLVAALHERGLKLSWARYLRDEVSTIASALKESLATGEVVFSFGGIGNTPDDYTRQAAARALGVNLVLHPDAEREIRARFGEAATPARLLLGHFPEGSAIIPNPVNRIAGFSIQGHYFLPGFPQMAHPMLEWVLDTYYSHLFHLHPTIEKAVLISGEEAYEGAFLGLMENIVARYPTLRLFSLPSLNQDGRPRLLELGVEGEPLAVAGAMQEIIDTLPTRKVTWTWRDPTP